jgi:ABC-type sugar transport system ATPase subunit
VTTAGLAVRSVSKSFGAVAALEQVSFDVAPGEIHALVGENGAGKSTLMGILSGVLQPDHGSIVVNGQEGPIRSPRAAQAKGIGTVFQELSLVGSLSVAENVFAGRVPTRLGFVRWSVLDSDVRHLLQELGLEIDPHSRVDRLPIGTRQMIEIAKALSLKARILLLDEPTSALSQDEKQALFAVVRKLAANGIAIVYISHHLDEVFSLAHRITVLRDGRSVAQFTTAEVAADTVVRAMVGRDIAPGTRRAAQISDQLRLACRGLTARGRFADVDLSVRAGEIVAVAGLMGSGRADLAKALSGVLPVDKGISVVDGQVASLRTLRAAMRRGIAYVPEERKTEGLFLSFDIASNIAATGLGRVSRAGLLRRDLMAAAAARHIRELRIKAQGPWELVEHLSGGNQQKVLLAKWLETAPRILIVDEPTKGVDVGAKFEIHALLRELAATGMAILLVSSDLPEIIAVADRIVVMRQGRVAGELAGGTADEEMVVALASGTRERRRDDA